MVQCANLRLTGSQIAHQSPASHVTRIDHPARLLKPQIGKEHFLLLRLQAGDVLLQLCTESEAPLPLRPLQSSELRWSCIFLLVSGKSSFVHIRSIDDLFGSEQIGLMEYAAHLIIFQKTREGTRRLSFLKVCLECFRKSVRLPQASYLPLQPCACVSLRSICSISERTSSKLMVSISRAGSTEPSTCTIFSFSKQRTTCTIASTSRMCDRNFFQALRPWKRRAQDLQYLRIQPQPVLSFWHDRAQSAAVTDNLEPRPYPHWDQWCKMDNLRSPRLHW